MFKIAPVIGVKNPPVADYLPDGDSFPVHVLARFWHVDPKHIVNLIDAGEIESAVDLRCPGASRSTIRVSRAAVITFLGRRRITVVGKNVH